MSNLVRVRVLACFTLGSTAQFVSYHGYVVNIRMLVCFSFCNGSQSYWVDNSRAGPDLRGNNPRVRVPDAKVG